MLNKNPGTIRDILVKNGVEMRSNKQNSRKYSVNDDYFSIIDTEEKAYWLGFIFADGYISNKNGKRVGITLKSSDRDHIIKFAKAISATYPVNT